MEQLLARDPLQRPQDPEGSLVDADMGAYYTWINQSRLAGADWSRFLVWFERLWRCVRCFPHIAARDDLYGVCEYAAGSGLDAVAIALARKASKLRGEEASRSRSSSLHWQRRRAPRLRAVPFCSADAKESTFAVVGSSATVYYFSAPISGHAPEQIHKPRNGRAEGSKRRTSPWPVLLR